MHPNAIYAKLSQELAETEARINARFDVIDARFDVIDAKFDALIERMSRPPAPRKAEVSQP